MRRPFTTHFPSWKNLTLYINFFFGLPQIWKSGRELVPGIILYVPNSVLYRPSFHSKHGNEFTDKLTGDKKLPKRGADLVQNRRWSRPWIHRCESEAERGPGESWEKSTRQKKSSENITVDMCKILCSFNTNKLVITIIKGINNYTINLLRIRTKPK